MKPYPGKNISEEMQVHNYRLSRAGRTIENVFGILAARWRIFRRPIRAIVNTVENIIKACVCLHNYFKQTDSAKYTPICFVDSTDSTGNITEGNWRSDQKNQQSHHYNLFADQGATTFLMMPKLLERNSRTFLIAHLDRYHGS